MDYEAILNKVTGHPVEAKISFLMEELPHLWRRAYEAMSKRQVSLVRIRQSSFEYIYDNYCYLEASGVIPYSLVEDRLVGVLGLSAPQPRLRDDYRLRGWVGPTEKVYGKQFDKGHFIAHAIGGAVDRSEMNVFVQRRDLNRGWSPEGKLYREMEKYCVSNPGVFCFSRPLYKDSTSQPTCLEFGILKGTGELWVECFDNR